jgi:phosphoenolpyruvate carboxykinase (GTP)
VYESRSWQHGTFLGATLSSETTAAASGKLGVLRRDPMAMLPFCGYNMADYWAHWLSMASRASRPPKVFRVNWFRTGAAGRYLWPGFGENLRVIKWVLERCAGRGQAVDTPIGAVPTRDAIDRRGIELGDEALDELLRVDLAEWIEAVQGQQEFFATFGERLPAGIREEHDGLARRIEGATPPELRSDGYNE